MARPARRRQLLAALAGLLFMAACPSDRAPEAPERTQPAATVVPRAETPPTDGDADDPAVWRDAADPGRSVVIATDKDNGLVVYDLTGARLHLVEGTQPNNVDLRDGVRLGDGDVSLVVAGDDESGTLLAYRVDAATRGLVDVAARRLATGVSPYGFCLYRSSASGRLYAFAADPDGRVEQWELFDDGRGRIDIRRVRGPWDVGGQVEGCVADDALGVVYLAEENAGIWRYGAEPGDPTSERREVDRTGGGGRLVADVEGLTLLARPDGTGLLIASSQGDSTFLAYRREGSNSFVQRFRVGPGTGVDGCEDTDGIDLRAEDLGPAFPDGVFVCQDGENEGGGTNFKLVPLELIPG